MVLDVCSDDISCEEICEEVASEVRDVVSIELERVCVDVDSEVFSDVSLEEAGSDDWLGVSLVFEEEETVILHPVIAIEAMVVNKSSNVCFLIFLS